MLHHNTLPPRSHFFPFQSEEAALTYDHQTSFFVQPLSGTWRFHHSPNPLLAPEIPAGAEKLDTTDSNEWGDIAVPGMWQLQGYGPPQRKNVSYPFSMDPPNIPPSLNETGTYQYEFQISDLEDVVEEVQYRVRFEGVDSAFHLWVNGRAIGYSQGSRNPAEFDVSEYVKSGSNWITVRVYRFCDGS